MIRRIGLSGALARSRCAMMSALVSGQSKRGRLGAQRTTPRLNALLSRGARGVQRIVEVVLLFLDLDFGRGPAPISRRRLRVSQFCKAFLRTLAGFCLRHCGTNDRCHSTDAQCLRAMAFVLGVTDRSRPLDRISKFQLTLPGRSARLLPQLLLLDPRVSPPGVDF